MASVSRLIHELSSRHAPRTALVELRLDAASGRYERGRCVRYRELHELVLRLADALAARGVGRGERVAVLLDNGVELVAAEWACLVSGMVLVALNVRSSAAEHAAILRDCSPSAVLVSPRHRVALDRGALAPGCIVIETGGREWDAFVASGRPVAPAREPFEEEPVRLRYTSGTAGLPKGAVLPRRCYDASVEAVSEVIGPLAPGDVLAQMAPITHAAGAMWLPHAVAGATALVADHFDAAAFVDLVIRERVTAVFLVPTMLVRFLEAVAASAARPSSLRSIVYGGAAMPVDRLERGLALLGPVFVQIYGLTESNWPVTALRRDEHLVPPDAGAVAQRGRLASCGRPTAVGRVRVVRADGSDCEAGEAGEMLVRGRNTMLGYWSRDGTLRRGDAKGLDDEGWMHTGDVAVRDADGFLTIVDRLHDMIVSGGFNVYPREVEDALSSHPAVLEAAVVGRPDPDWGERVHAVVVLRDGMRAPGEAELAAHVAERTAAYKKPRSFEFVRDLPKNAAGKVLRRALKTATPPA